MGIRAETTAPAPLPNPTSPPLSGIPGQSPLGEPSINPITAIRALDRSPFLIAPPMHNATDAQAAAWSSLPLSPPAPLLPRLARTSSATVGYVDGVVLSATYPHTPISGASVSVEPVAGFCPVAGCVPETTVANGTFDITAATGENTLLVSAPYYVTNRTWVNVTDGGWTSVGTIQLIQDGYITGFLLTDDSAQEPAAWVNLTAVTRDGTFEAFPMGGTSANGSFTIPVPPEPSQINFNPNPLNTTYLGNVTFVNASAGRTLDIGTVYLEHYTQVSVNLVDSITGEPISGAQGSMSVCSKVSGACAQVNFSTLASGSSLSASAPVGPDSVSVSVAGYVENTTSLGLVPTSPLNGPAVPMGTVELVPDGVLGLEINITGIPAPYGTSPPTSLWPVGKAVVEACNLDGLTTTLTSLIPAAGAECVGICVSPGVPFELPAAPLRTFISAAPDTAAECGYPYPLWPIPPDLPVTPSWGWANVTPGHLLEVGSIDLLPGTYVQGQVFPKNESNWTVNICSTDESTECLPAVTSDAGYLGDPLNAPPSDCPNPTASAATYTFCAPAPPGPVRITVTSPTASANWSWAEVPYLQWTDNPLPLAMATTPSAGAIWLVAAELSGRIEAAGSFAPVPFASVAVCPAGLSAGANLCGEAVANASGYFESSAPIGWDQVAFSGPGYVSNSSWVLVDRNNTTGTLLLTPEADVEGQVVDSEGVGLYSATVESCPTANPTACSLVGGDGATSTDGHYFGSLAAGMLPLGTYEIEASAPGYTTDWTWVNVTTPGTIVTAPTIELAQLLAPTDFAPRADTPAPATASVGAWVVGRVVDADGGVGLPSCFVSAVPVDGGLPVDFIAAQGTGGEFNDSVPVGAYDVEVTEPGFFSASVFVNITGNVDPVSLGTIDLQPYPSITGRSVIDPAAWRIGVTDADGLGAPAFVTVCNPSAKTCASGFTDSSGDFNVSAPPGTYDEVNLTPLALVGPGTYAGGFLANQTYVNVANSTGLNGASPVIGLAIFGVVSGEVVAANTSEMAPVRYDAVELSTRAALDAGGAVSNLSGGTQLNAAGEFAMAFPPSPQLEVAVGGAGAWIPAAAVFDGTERGPGGSPTYALGVAGSLALGPDFSLLHYGWVVMQVTNSATSEPVPYATLSANEAGSLDHLPFEYTSSGEANALGYVNLSAPPSLPSNSTVALNLSGADYLYQRFSALVNSSETTTVNTSVGHGGVDLRPWGWVQGAVLDATTGAVISGVAIQAFDSQFQQGRSGITTNGAGVYFTDAPVTENDSISYQEPGYTFNLTSYSVSSGELLEAPPVALTGDGTVEGRVVALPGGAPVDDATVTTCPVGQAACPTQVATNVSGVFVIDAPAGMDSFTITAPGFSIPSPAYLQVGSDQWYWLPQIGIYSYADVIGQVLGIPGGLTVAGATVTLCPSADAGLGGSCFDTVQSDENGSFYLSGPAGQYVVEASAPFYNTTSLPLALTAGETLRVGLVFLYEYGVGTGLVETGPSLTPVDGANVSACEAWGERVCLGAVATGSNGRYVVAGPAGPYTLAASAAGFQTAYVAASLVSGSTTSLTTILLVPIGPGSRYVVSGFVLSAGPTPAPLADAVVTATGGSATGTSSSGAFSFELDWGSYTLTAAVPGYVTERVTRNITAPVADLNFSLSLMTYSVTGTVRDGLSDFPLDDVQVTQGGVPIGAESGANGSYALALPNGTHDLVATDREAASEYAAVPFVLTVVGTSVVRNLILDPPVDEVDGLVANALTGQSIAGATVLLSGVTSDGPIWYANTTTDSEGRFVAPAYPGVYRLAASALGYETANLSITLGSSSNTPVSLVLSPLATTGSASPGTTVGVVAAVAGAAVAGTILVLMLRRNQRAK